MSNDVLITPASRKIEFKDSSSNVDAKIETDSNGNLIITNPGGDISLGDTTADIFIGDGVNNIDLVFEQNGEIRGTSGVTITLGASGSNIVMGTDLNLSNNNITNVNDLTVAGDLTVTGTTTTLETATLNVEDKNITLNYGSGDTSGSANGAGITIQDAVDASTDATLLWNTASDGFEFSHDVNIAGMVTATGNNHTFYSGAGSSTASFGRNANERVIIYVDDGEIKLTADQDSDGNAEHRFILDRTFEGTGANNFIIRKGGSDQLLVDTNGNVGIGTSSPSYMLDVGGGDFFVNGTNRDWGGTGGLGTHIGTGDFDIYSGVPGGGTHRVRVTNAGRVGIGTSFPDTKLHVEGTAKVTKLRYTGGNESEGDEAITFRWNKPDNATSTTTWFKVCDVDIGTGTYKALSMVIKVTSANGNFGNSSNIEELYYVAEFNRSGAAQDDSDFAAIYGTNGDNCQLRIYKTGTGAYELQMKTPTNYRSNLLEATVNSANNGTVTVTDNDTTAGTTSGGTEYLVQTPTDSGEGHYTHVFPNINVTNNVGIGTANATTPLDVHGIVRVEENSNTAFYGGNYVRVFNDQNYGFRNSGGSTIAVISMSGNSYFNGGKVGIGTTTPSQILDVVGDLPSIRVGNNNATYRYAAIELGTAGGNWYISNGASKTTTLSDLYISRSTDGTDHRFRFGRDSYAFSIYDNADTEKVYLHADGDSYFNGGNVGIGTTSPENLLHLASSSDYEVVFDHTAQEKFRLRHGSSGIYMTGPDTSTLAFGIDQNHDVVILNSAGGTYATFEGATSRVGIGTTSPNNKLSVSGASDGINIIGTSSYLRWNSGDMMIRNEGSYAMGFHTYDGSSAMVEHMRITSAGNVGIGTTTPPYKLSVNSGTSDWPGHFKSTDNKAGIIIADNDTTAYFGAESSRAFMGLQAGIHANNLNIDSSGNVGIGTSSPAERLTVSGNQNITGKLAVGSASAHASYDFYNQNTAYFNGAVTIDDNLSVTNGSVGIGTSSPDGNLEVIAATTVSGASDSVNNVLIGLQSTNRPTIILDTADTTYTNRTWNITNVGSAGTLRIGRNGLDVMSLKNDGKVGIGTDSPTAKLEVNGGIKASGTSYFNGSVSLNSGGQIGSGFIVSGDFEFEGADYSILFDGTANAIEWQDNAKATFGTGNDLQIYHDGTNVISASSGNIVIDQNTDNGFITLRADDGSGGIASYFQIDGTNEIVKSFKDFNVDGDLYLSEYIYHTGDTNTYVRIQSDSFTFRTGGNDRLTINNGGTTLGDNLAMGGNNIENAGTISSGAISTSANLDMNANDIIDVNQINGTGGTGWLDFNMDTDSVYPTGNTDNVTVLGSITHMNFVGDSNGNGTGGDFYWGYGVNNADSGTFTQTMALDRSGNLTTTGDIDLTGTSDTGDEKIMLPRSGYIAFYGNTDLSHAISSMGTDDIRINSYGEIILNLDSNENQTSAANFRIIKHGGSSSAGTSVFSIDGENGNATFTGDISTTTGTIQINGNDVIDDSRNLTNIATMSVNALGSPSVFSVLSSGNTEIGGTLQVLSNTTLDGDLSVGDDLTVTGGFTDLNKSRSSTSDAILELHNTNSTNYDGRYFQIRDHNGTTRGTIGTKSETNINMYISGGGAGLKFSSYITYKVIRPVNDAGTDADNQIDLGTSTARFDDIYATNGTIQTSDRNEKQDIQALTEAEQRVATACKSLIRRFRWQDSVAEKDDNPDSDETARYHFGIIAQDLQAAFTAEGLDAGDYGMFISSTWTDDEGNEQTRLGVRYNELLAFIIATL